MRKSRVTEEQIIKVLKEHAAGQTDEGCDFDFLQGTARTPEPEIHQSLYSIARPRIRGGSGVILVNAPNALPRYVPRALREIREAL